MLGHFEAQFMVDRQLPYQPNHLAVDRLEFHQLSLPISSFTVKR